MGKWQEARGVYLEFVESAKSDPSQIGSLERVVEKFWKAGEYQTCSAILKDMKAMSSDGGKIIGIDFKLARLTALTRDEEAGIDAFLSIAYQNPDSGLWPAKARLEAGILYERIGNSLAAERQFKLVAENWPGSEEARLAARRLFELANIKTDIKEEQIQN